MSWYAFPLTLSTALFFTLSAPAQHLTRSGPGVQVEPLRARAFQLNHGGMNYAGDWIELGAPAPRTRFLPVFDTIELALPGGTLGAPTDSPPGCTWSVPPGSRWHYGAFYDNPFISEDLATDAAGAGAQCEGVALAWWWNVGANEPDHDGDGRPDVRCVIAVATFEQIDVSCAPNAFDDGSGFIDGVTYDFGELEAGTDYYYAAIDLTGTGLWHTMPADGLGGYQLMLLMHDPDVGELTIPTGINPATGLGVATQPMLWGTGDAEITRSGLPQPDGRVGTQLLRQYDDNNPPNGVHDIDASDPDAIISPECKRHYDFAGLCPRPICAAIGFYAVDPGNPCPCPADVDADGDRDLQDLASLLAQFGRSGSPGSLGCADTDADGNINLADLATLLSAFGLPC